MLALSTNTVTVVNLHAFRFCLKTLNFYPMREEQKPSSMQCSDSCKTERRKTLTLYCYIRCNFCKLFFFFVCQHYLSMFPCGLAVLYVAMNEIHTLSASHYECAEYGGHIRF